MRHALYNGNSYLLYISTCFIVSSNTISLTHFAVYCLYTLKIIHIATEPHLTNFQEILYFCENHIIQDNSASSLAS